MTQQRLCVSGVVAVIEQCRRERMDYESNLERQIDTARLSRVNGPSAVTRRRPFRAAGLLPAEPAVARFVDFAHVAGADGSSEDLVWAETGDCSQGHVYFVGTRAFSSSNQFCTRIISAALAAGRSFCWTIRNRRPFGATS